MDQIRPSEISQVLLVSAVRDIPVQVLFITYKKEVRYQIQVSKIMCMDLMLPDVQKFMENQQQFNRHHRAFMYVFVINKGVLYDITIKSLSALDSREQ